MTKIKHDCSKLSAKIIGRALNMNSNRSARKLRFGQYKSNELVSVCPICDVDFLSLGNGIKLPFISSDNVMRTVDDITKSQRFRLSKLNFCGFMFSRSALINAMTIARQPSKNSSRLTTNDLEALGSSFESKLNHKFCLDFSKKVCSWGRGERVWANLERMNKKKLGGLLLRWFKEILKASNEKQALSSGIAIKGLDVSFASKHLRMIDPQKYAVLDYVISEGIGFADNIKGYSFFMRSLREFRTKYKLGQNVATLESGIFILVNQLVRGKERSSN